MTGKDSAKRAVAVTGASGMLGRHLCAHLSSRGWEVRALVRDPASFTEAVPGVAAGRCDLPAIIEETLLAEVSAVIHCAYATRVTDPTEAQRINEDGTRRILDVSRRAGVPRFVFISTVAANPDAPNYYARSKHALERLLDPERDLVVRPGLIIAKQGQGLFQQMRDITRRTHLVPLFGGGTQPLQTVHVEDLCEALARALERDLVGAVNIAEPEPASMATFMRMLAERLQVRCLFLPLPFAPVLAVLRVIEAIRLPFPLRSESLLAVKGLQQLPVKEDLRRLDMVVRGAKESLDDAL